MAIELYFPFDKALYIYSLQRWWLDINEDKIEEEGDTALAFMDLVNAYTKELVTLLKELDESLEVETIGEIHKFVNETRTNVWTPYYTVAKTAIPISTARAREGVIAAKLGVIGVLASNLASDLPFIISGQIWMILGKKALISSLLNQLLYEARVMAIEELTTAITGFLEAQFLNEAKDQWAEDLLEASFRLAGVEEGSRDGSSSGAKLALATVDVSTCLNKLTVATYDFVTRAEENWYEGVADRIGDGSEGDGLVRIALAEVFEWMCAQLTGFAVDLALGALDALTDMVTNTDEKLQKAEQEIFDKAADLRITLAELRPAGRANASGGAPDFFAPVIAAGPAGDADANAEDPDSLDAPVDQQRGIGPARANPQDVSVLDAPTTAERAVGRASGADGGDTADVDGTVVPTSGPGTPSGGGSDAPGVDSSVDTTEGVDVPSSDSSGDDVTELDAEVDPVS